MSVTGQNPSVQDEAAFASRRGRSKDPARAAYTEQLGRHPQIMTTDGIDTEETVSGNGMRVRPRRRCRSRPSAHRLWTRLLDGRRVGAHEARTVSS